jgi:hypothetical protein
VQPGEDYHVLPFAFHETLANEPTLTIMTKQPFDGARAGVNSTGATVMVPVGQRPDNDFRREAVDASVLWELIKEAHPCA